MAELIVVEGAALVCTEGSAPATLTVTGNTIEKIGGLLVATVDDSVGIFNIPTFGTCTILTNAAEGEPCPCLPAPQGDWAPGATTHTIGGIAVLTASATVKCSTGGTISINDPAQTAVKAS
jgi:hypothetical protein